MSDGTGAAAGAAAAARARAGQIVRRLPAGVRLLRARRVAAAGMRQRVCPIRPPVDPPERAAALGAASERENFITGNGIAARCRYVLNYDVLNVNERADNEWWFCKADFLEYFFAELRPSDDFVLFSHNSDRPIDGRFRRELGRRRLVAWFAQNAALVHPKLRALPIGIANPRWRHGDQEALLRVRAERSPKTELFDVAFSLETNETERRYCLEQTGLTPRASLPFEEHLRRVAGACFSIAPRGNGIDTHRPWEALYLRTVPVVTRSLVTDHHPDLPMVVLDDWSQFETIEFSRDLYERTWGDWSPDSLRLDRYLERIARELEGWMRRRR